MMDLHPDFSDLLVEFASADVCYALLGGYAVAYHGDHAPRRISTCSSQDVRQIWNASPVPFVLLARHQTLSPQLGSSMRQR